MKKENGFTLVELAIVLMIIGLLIGGVLRGQELMENARVTSTIQQVKAYQGAMNTFQSIYNNYPGDMVNADSKLPGCQVGNSNNCLKGNGDGMIGAPMPTPWCCSLNSTMTNENQQFWKHLALAHLITGVDPSAATPEWGHSNPTAPDSAGFFVVTSTWTNATPGGAFSGSGMPGMLLLLRRSISGQWDCGGGGNGMSSLCALSAQRAAQVDRKMDDGTSLNGDVQCVSSDWHNGCGIPGTSGAGANGYDETRSDKSTELFFKL